MIAEFELPTGERFRMTDERDWEYDKDLPAEVVSVLEDFPFEALAEPITHNPVQGLHDIAQETKATLIKLDWPEEPADDDIVF